MEVLYVASRWRWGVGLEGLSPNKPGLLSGIAPVLEILPLGFVSSPCWLQEKDGAHCCQYSGVSYCVREQLLGSS